MYTSITQCTVHGKILTPTKLLSAQYNKININNLAILLFLCPL